MGRIKEQNRENAARCPGNHRGCSNKTVRRCEAHTPNGTILVQVTGWLSQIATVRQVEDAKSIMRPDAHRDHSYRSESTGFARAARTL